MIRKFRLLTAIAGGITLLALIWTLGSIALAQEGDVHSPMTVEGPANPEAQAAPVPGGPGFVSLSAFAFMPYNPADKFAYIGTGIYNPGTSSAFYEAPISLPHGATVTKFVAYFYDNDSNDAHDLTALLKRAPFDNLVSIPMAMASSGMAADSFRYNEDITIDTPLIDDSTNSYQVELYLPPSNNVRLVGVRVDYAYLSNLPAVQK